MNPKSKPTKSQELASRLEFARLQQIRAESNLENAKESARLAKRRRKEAKQAFRRARKEVKRAKLELRKTEELITETEAKFAKAEKVQAEKRPRARRRRKTQASEAKSSRLPGKALTPPIKKRVERKGQPSLPPAAKIAPAEVPPPEPGKREESPSVVQTNSMPL